MRVFLVLIVGLTGCTSADDSPVSVTTEPLSCAADAGTDRYDTVLRPTAPVSWSWTWGGGITVADVDDDGHLDVIQPIETGLEVLWGPDVTDVPADSFGDLDLSYASGTSVADYDGDGDLDVYVMRVRGFPIPESSDSLVDHGRNRLLRNDGNRQFTDVTATAGVSGCGQHHRTERDACYRTTTSSWGDLDQDGDLDLFVGNYGLVDDTPGTRQVDMEPGEPSFLYLNQGDGTFVSSPLPKAVHDGYTFAGGLLDLDDDGWLDLYVVNDFGVLWPNQVLFNEGGSLVLDDENTSGLVQSMTGMGLAAAHLDDDGWLDLAIPNWQNHALFESRPDRGLWVETAAARGMVNARARNQKVGWGTWFGDLDNDGDLDAISQFGFVRNDNPVWRNPGRQGDAVYLNDGASPPSFEDVGYDWGLAHPGVGRGAVLADLNRDGWLDIVKRDLKGDTRFHFARCGSARALLVRLRHIGANPSGVGARVTVGFADRKVHRDLFAGGQGYASAGPRVLHVGVGDVDVVDHVTVRWPDGVTTRVEGIPTNHAVTLVRDR